MYTKQRMTEILINLRQKQETPGWGGQRAVSQVFRGQNGLINWRRKSGSKKTSKGGQTEPNLTR